MGNSFSRLGNHHSNTPFLVKNVLLHLVFHIVMIIKLKNHLMLKHSLCTYYLSFKIKSSAFNPHLLAFQNLIINYCKIKLQEYWTCTIFNIIYNIQLYCLFFLLGFHNFLSQHTIQNTSVQYEFRV